MGLIDVVKGLGVCSKREEVSLVDLAVCYIKDFEVHDPHRVGNITVQLLGRINDCRALTYRQDIKAASMENYKTRTLPTRQWGYVVITTPNGVLDHEEAMRQNVGGQVIGYFY
ncbi:40S ribosomal protein S15a-5-like [Solanum pennellii]|uniref:40S ribosomal protein S15a-5-like n=1 Tax=Solanum pennellii TaxID=28526 RepID=A0ABM1V1J3_SOLPN|nr:40S ribosomal protein S15a-5-like [Solanum pennellii]